MKLKDAIDILTKYQGIAGPDANVHVDKFHLLGGVAPGSMEYGYSRTEQKVKFAVTVEPPQQPVNLFE